MAVWRSNVSKDKEQAVLSEDNVSKDIAGRCDWRTVIAECQEKDCFSYHTKLLNCAREADERGDSATAKLLRLLGLVTSFVLKPDSPDQPFVPWFFDAKHHTGSPENLSEAELTILRGLLPEVSDPELRARITDVLWLREGDHLMAETAVESYLKSSSRLAKMAKWHPFLESVKRATNLARSLKNPNLLAKCVAFIESFLDDSGDGGDSAAAVLMELLQEFREGDPAKYARLAKQMALIAEKRNDWNSAHWCWTIKAKWHAIENDAEKEREARVRAAKTFERSAEDARSRTQPPPSYIAATAHLRDAIADYRRIGGMQDHVKILQAKLLDYEGHIDEEMGTISVSMDITPLVDVATDAVKGKTILQALYALAFIIDPPKVSDLEKGALDTMKQSFKYLVDEKKVNQDGKVTAKRPAVNPNDQKTSDVALRSAIMERANMHRHLVAGASIKSARDQINREHQVRVEELLPLVTYNVFVPPGREKIFAIGLYAGLTGDFLIALHLLIPQLENSLRYLLTQRGIITSMLTDELVQDEYPLTTIIYFTDLKEILGEDLTFDLQGVLVDRFGFNLRNRVAHGLINFDEFFLSSEASYLWWIALRLCCMFKDGQERRNSP
jgi:hypothetical protein